MGLQRLDGLPFVFAGNGHHQRCSPMPCGAGLLVHADWLDSQSHFEIKTSAMPTYVYETIPQKPGQKPKSFEVKQSMHDAALTRHPETGEPVQRIISGGIGLITHHASPPPREGCCRANGGECPCSCEN